MPYGEKFSQSNHIKSDTYHSETTVKDTQKKWYFVGRKSKTMNIEALLNNLFCVSFFSLLHVQLQEFDNEQTQLQYFRERYCFCVCPFLFGFFSFCFFFAIQLDFLFVRLLLWLLISIKAFNGCYWLWLIMNHLKCVRECAKIYIHFIIILKREWFNMNVQKKCAKNQMEL